MINRLPVTCRMSPPVGIPPEVEVLAVVFEGIPTSVLRFLDPACSMHQDGWQGCSVEIRCRHSPAYHPLDFQPPDESYPLTNGLKAMMVTGRMTRHRWLVGGYNMYSASD